MFQILDCTVCDVRNLGDYQPWIKSVFCPLNIPGKLKNTAIAAEQSTLCSCLVSQVVARTNSMYDMSEWDTTEASMTASITDNIDLLQIENSRSFRLAAGREYPKIAIPNFGLLERSANRRGFRASFFSVCLPEEEEASSSVQSWLISCGQLVSLFVAQPPAG